MEFSHFLPVFVCLLSRTEGRGRRKRGSSRGPPEETTTNKEAPTTRRSERKSKLLPSSSPANCDKSALAKCNTNPPGNANSKALRGRDISSEIESESQDFQDSVSSKVLDDGVLNVGNIFLGAPGSNYRTNVTQVHRLLTQMVASRLTGCIEQGSSIMKGNPAAFYVCGPAGVGKTTAVTWCCKDVKKLLNGDWKKHGIAPAVVDMNCTQFEAGNADFRNSFFEKVWETCDPTSLKRDESSLWRSLKSANSRDKRRFLILVLDEIDQLVLQNTESQQARNNGEKLLRDLNSWADDSDVRFVLVGISNAMNNVQYRRVNHFVKVRCSLS